MSARDSRHVTSHDATLYTPHDRSPEGTSIQSRSDTEGTRRRLEARPLRPSSLGPPLAPLTHGIHENSAPLLHDSSAARTACRHTSRQHSSISLIRSQLSSPPAATSSLPQRVRPPAPEARGTNGGVSLDVRLELCGRLLDDGHLRPVGGLRIPALPRTARHTAHEWSILCSRARAVTRFVDSVGRLRLGGAPYRRDESGVAF